MKRQEISVGMAVWFLHPRTEANRTGFVWRIAPRTGRVSILYLQDSDRYGVVTVEPSRIASEIDPRTPLWKRTLARKIARNASSAAYGRTTKLAKAAAKSIRIIVEDQFAGD